MSTKDKDAVVGEASPATSNARKQLAAWVGTKFKASQETTKSMSDLVDKQAVLNDYAITFNGAKGALEAIGTSADVMHPLVLVMDMNEAELSSIEAEVNATEKRLALEAELNA